MFYDKVCGVKLDLVKAGVAVGFYDIISIIIEVFIEFKFYVGFETFQLISLGIFSIAILCNVLLIHGATAINHSLLIYWIVLASIRVLLNTIMLLILMYFGSFKDVFFVYCTEIIEFVLLILCYIIVWKLYIKLKTSVRNDFSVLNENV
ncbi:CLUMA_CG011653, isoform A [Clunio marinus]|uniref:CLUMA_CG011653, isoform A n=1 Tax=Clunio marinus TaxID=568069 RepID=A0A1J1IDJ5_9DIPT|nr:CLUMA_CG011653, isoform A [Clunio marinus]